jgi:hypothetical protein
VICGEMWKIVRLGVYPRGTISIVIHKGKTIWLFLEIKEVVN